MSSDEKLDEIIRRIGLLETGVQNLGTRLESLEHDSNDVKQGIVNLGTRVEALETHQATYLQPMQETLNALRADMAKGFQRLEQKIDLLVEDTFELRTDQRLLQGRVDKLEEKAS